MARDLLFALYVPCELYDSVRTCHELVRRDKEVAGRGYRLTYYPTFQVRFTAGVSWYLGRIIRVVSAD
jgi:hypothetical protein